MLERGERLFTDWEQTLETFRHVHEERKKEAEEAQESSKPNERCL